jgi:diguanylate cyclase (GGDEF)-like protein
VCRTLLNRASLRAWFLPGGLLLLAAGAVLQSGFVPISSQAIDLYYYAAFIAGVLIAWRFNSSQVMFALFTLILGHHAIEFFAAGHRLLSGPGRIALEAVSLLIPINFIVFSVVRERGFAVPSVAPRLFLLFFEAVLVAVICRPGEITGPHVLHSNILGAAVSSWSRIPQLALLTFVVALGVLLARVSLGHRPVEHGLMWSLLAAFVGLQAGAISRNGEAYFATAGLILVASLLENSYFLAYHDELTSLPARRAFNDALLSLEAPFAIAMVDIDHFKKVNDTYGHDTGDQVLSMVASRLARIGTGGKAYRVGGEEFSILFPGKNMKEVVPELDALRISISELSFRVRATPERRQTVRGPDRRQGMKQFHSKRTQTGDGFGSGQLSVTVSIGIAEPNSTMRSADEVIQAADKALYRAKRDGRNRVETAKVSRSFARRAASG